jgi:hypothetical protein
MVIIGRMFGTAAALGPGLTARPLLFGLEGHHPVVLAVAAGYIRAL